MYLKNDLAHEFVSINLDLSKVDIAVLVKSCLIGAQRIQHYKIQQNIQEKDKITELHKKIIKRLKLVQGDSSLNFIYSLVFL